MDGQRRQSTSGQIQEQPEAEAKAGVAADGTADQRKPGAGAESGKGSEYSVAPPVLRRMSSSATSEFPLHAPGMLTSITSHALHCKHPSLGACLVCGQP